MQTEMPAAGADKAANLYFGTAGEMAELSRREDASVAYIILQNDRLHSQVDRAARRLRDSERERERASEDADRAERSRVCLRGMLHNEVEKSAIREGITHELGARVEATDRLCGRLMANSMAHTVVALAAHAAEWAFNDPVVCRAAFAVHVGNAAVFAALCCGLLRGAHAGVRASDAELESLRESLASAERGTEHLHEVVDEL